MPSLVDRVRRERQRATFGCVLNHRGEKRAVVSVRSASRRRRVATLDGDDLALIRALQEVDPELACEMEKSIRAEASRLSRSDALSHAIRESDLVGDATSIDDAIGSSAARWSHGAGGGRHRPRMPGHA